MYVKVRKDMEVKDVVKEALNSDGYYGFISDATYRKAKEVITVANGVVSLDEAVGIMLSGNYKWVGIYLSSTSIRGYYRTVVVGK